jgi:hypothetical protein
MSEAVLKWVERCWRSHLSHASTQPRTLQTLILNLLCLRLCEQSRLIAHQQWRSLLDSLDSYDQLFQLVQTVHKHCGAIVLAPELQPMLRVRDTALRQVISELDEICREEAIDPILLGQAYEQCLSYSTPLSQPTANARKTSGSYYTPLSIVDYIVCSTIFTSSPSTFKVQNLDRAEARRQTADGDYSTPNNQHPRPNTLLDPSCGGGIFLLTAYQYLLTQQLRHYVADDPERWIRFQGNGVAPLVKGTDGNWQLSWSERDRILQECIHGVDIDPVAVEVTRLALRFKLLETESHLATATLPVSVPDLSHNIQWGNALIGFDFSATPSLNFNPDRIVAFDWHQAFPKILDAGGFDVVLGNPPYLDAEGMTAHLPEWRTYCSARYKTAAGNWDLFCVFIEKALQLCRPGGLISFVVPNKLISADYAAKTRSLLIHENQLLSIRDYSQMRLFSVAVYPLVFVARKGTPDRQATICYEVMDKLIGQPSNCNQEKERSCSVNVIIREHYTISYNRYLVNPEAPWLLSSPSHHVDLVERLCQNFLPLGKIAHVTGAATVAEAYALQPLIQNNPVPDLGDLQLVNSGTIDRYRFCWGEKPLRYLGNTYDHPVIPRSRLHHLTPKRQQQATQAKIIVAGMSKVLESGLDAQGTVLAGKSTSVIRLASNQQDLDLRYFLGLLNSRLIHLYFSSSFGGNQLQGGYFRVGPPQLRQIPICLPEFGDAGDRRSINQIIGLVNQILSLQLHVSALDSTRQTAIHHQIHQLDKQVDELVYSLYRLTDRDIEQVMQTESQQT